MTVAIRTKNRAMLDSKIDQFCEKSAELLAGIHDRHDNGDSEKPKRKRKRKKKKDTL
jgi:hypothetical protein